MHTAARPKNRQQQQYVVALAPHPIPQTPQQHRDNQITMAALFSGSVNVKATTHHHHQQSSPSPLSIENLQEQLPAFPPLADPALLHILSVVSNEDDEDNIEEFDEEFDDDDE